MSDDHEVVVVPSADVQVDLRPDEPPIVARLVIEIRSDGSRTIARGALKDANRGQEVAIEAEGSSPLALAGALVKAMLRAPALSRVFTRALLRGKRDGRR